MKGKERYINRERGRERVNRREMKRHRERDKVRMMIKKECEMLTSTILSSVRPAIYRDIDGERKRERE